MTRLETGEHETNHNEMGTNGLPVFIMGDLVGWIRGCIQKFPDCVITK
jgi:hypothetical protein